MACCLTLLMLTACGNSDDNTNSTAWTPHKFSVSDAYANGVKLGMTTDEVKKAIGDPDKEDNITEDQFIYGEHLDMTYGKMNLSFYDINEGEDYVLGSISSDSADVIFAGGLHVGSTKEEVLAAYTKEDDAADLMLSGEKYGTFLYGNITSEEFVVQKPTGKIETAFIQDHDAEADGYYMIIYEFYNPLNWSEDATDFTGDYYHIVFYVDTATDKVSSILLEHMKATV